MNLGERQLEIGKHKGYIGEAVVAIVEKEESYGTTGE